MGIGASAGGLEALQQLFDAMPSDSGMCFVIVQHLDPSQQSQLAQILTRHTSMPVIEIQDGMKIEPDHVYVILPDWYVTVEDGVLRLRKPDEPRARRKPIDVFFRSLAEDQQERAVCILLSGTGTNGTLGLADVKAHGGMVIVQEPREAKFDGMPRSAISHGLADFVLKVDEMPQVLGRYIAHPYVQDLKAHEQLPETDLQAFHEILNLLKRRRGHDFQPYKRPTLLRRIHRRMGLKFVHNMREYLALLRQDAQEASLLANELFIKVTGFFRDPEAWKVLEEQVVAPLVERAGDDGTIRAWAAGCASGEEAYSLAMLLIEHAEKANRRVRIRVFATDPSDTLDRARAGVYPSSIAADVSAKRLERFFEMNDSEYRVVRELRDAVTFAPHNLISDPPFSQLDIITCRNLLIYLDPQIQPKAIALFHFALREGGTLFLGSAETIGRQTDLFKPVHSRWRIYSRIGPTRYDRIGLDLLSGRRERPPFDGQDREAAAVRPRQTNLAGLAEREIVRRFGPVATLLDETGRVLYIHGDAEKFLTLPRGEVTGDVLAMSRQGLRGRLRTMITRVLREGEARTETAQVKREDNRFHPVVITCTPLQEPVTGDPLVLVSFEDKAQPPAHPSTDPGEATAEGGVHEWAVNQFEEELRVTREELQSTIEQLESANEEYRASNEEMTSINEELQSTNEELETSKEELQSLNEELNTVNAQLQSKVEELEHANNDLKNVLVATDIATVFLDTDMNIRWFSPAMTRMLNLINTDIGRPISDLAQKAHGADLEADARKVLETLVPVENEVADENGRCYLHRTLPYRTDDNRIEGAVVTFTDITDRKQVEDRLRNALDYAEKVIDTVREPILVLDPDLRVRSTNDAFCEVFKTSREKTLGRLVYEIADGQWDIPDLRVLLEDVLPANEAMENYEVTQEFKHIGRRSMLLNARRVDHVQFILLAIEDVTERRRAREQQEILLRELSHRVKNALITAQAIASQSARQSDSLDEFIAGFEGRLKSMAKAYNLLSQRSWKGIELKQLLELEITPYSQPDSANCELIGPPVHLPAETALAMQLVLHELTTNAAKYGALSTESGRVRVRWDIESGPDGTPMLWLRWVERGGPPVRTPDRFGFGSQLIQTTVEYDLHGEYEASYPEKGFRCEIAFPWRADLESSLEQALE